MMNFDKYLTIEAAAEMSNYHPDYIRKLCRANKITCQKMGQMWLVERESFEKYLAHPPKPGPKPR